MVDANALVKRVDNFGDFSEKERDTVTISVEDTAGV